MILCLTFKSLVNLGLIFEQRKMGIQFHFFSSKYSKPLIEYPWLHCQNAQEEVKEEAAPVQEQEVKEENKEAAPAEKPKKTSTKKTAEKPATKEPAAKKTAPAAKAKTPASKKTATKTAKTAAKTK